MQIIVDASTVLSVVLNEPQKQKIINKTQEVAIISTEILPYEIGNALIALEKRKKITNGFSVNIFQLFNTIEIRLIPSNIENALVISSEYGIHAYDAYYLELAKRLGLPIMTLDKKMQNIALKLNIALCEV